MHATPVDHNRRQPGLKGRGTFEAVNLLKDSQEGILNHILCCCVVPQNDAGKVVDTVLEMDEHRIASVRVSVRPGGQEATEEDASQGEAETEGAVDAEAAESDTQEGAAALDESSPVSVDAAADKRDSDRKPIPGDYRKEA